MDGWIKLHRKLLDSDMYKTLNSTHRDVLIQCLLLASHKHTKWLYKGKPQACSPGQFKTSLETLRKRCAKGTTIKQIRGALDKLGTWRFLASKGASTGRIITIINWNTYQNGHTGEGQIKGQAEGQREGKARTTIKNDKNVKNIKNIYSKNSIEFRLSELLFNLILERNPKNKKHDLQKWALQVDRMVRLDSRKVVDIEDVIKWSQANEFWQNNIISTQKLRDKFDQLYMKMEAENAKSKTSTKFTGLNKKDYNEGIF